MQKLSRRSNLAIGIVLTISWVSTGLYLVNDLVQGGIRADETHTSGLITANEVLLGVVVVFLIVMSIVFFGFAQKSKQKSK